MSDTDEAECPVDDCAFRGDRDSLTSHIGAKTDDEHDIDALRDQLPGGSETSEGDDDPTSTEDDDRDAGNRADEEPEQVEQGGDGGDPEDGSGPGSPWEPESDGASEGAGGGNDPTSTGASDTSGGTDTGGLSLPVSLSPMTVIGVLAAAAVVIVAYHHLTPTTEGDAGTPEGDPGDTSNPPEPGSGGGRDPGLTPQATDDKRRREQGGGLVDR